MTLFRQYIAPFLIVLVFLVALLAVSSRIFLPNDMAAPAPIEEVDAANWRSPTTNAIASSLTINKQTLPLPRSLYRYTSTGV
ncbi:MAG: hypothetical protein F6J92_11840 [Symploca sp. SIO1A3]|nr:hypothetical protein [Symploca sp. SIO2C1]NER47368.1 hypothetical protein [Symploca sp. SIO1A3]